MSEMDHLPYKTINVFLSQNYLSQLLEEILNKKNSLNKEDQIEFSKHFRQYVKILGFRNPTIAPLPLQIKAFISAFEEHEEVIPFTLSTWVKIRQSFAEKVKVWLEEHGWKNLQLKRDFQESEGFQNTWPQKWSLDKLVKDFNKDNPDEESSREDLILMVLWISGQLPKEETQL